jgi:D-alanyl-lipoteichoic acid acyltransferase DltB (MBOAT superfamily)
MLFNSLDFLIFFPAVTALYFWVPQSFRWLLLLIASCYFYMTFIPVYILILCFTIMLDYCAGILIETSTGDNRRHFLIASLVANIGVLAFFKYFNFFNTNLEQLAHAIHWNYPIRNLSIILPIGLSFHTFQSMSYTIEVFRGHQKAERHFGIFALYVMFYPQLVAGPIERPQNLLHQFREPHPFKYERVTNGFKLMLWGLFKKVCIADRLTVLVDQAYGHPALYPGITFLVATIFFAFQIYCDFSGYSDIAIGAAQVMGFKLMDNFNRPYFSKSIAEFWKRWHISLSSWFRDYLYIPLGGSRVSKWRWYYNLMLTFIISGFWHGANWTYIAWGAINGFYLLFGIWTQHVRCQLAHILGFDRVPQFHKLLQMGMTFALVCIAWVFFRANTISDAIHIVFKTIHGILELFLLIKGGLLWHSNKGVSLFPLSTRRDMMISCGLIGFMESVHWIQRHGSIRQMLSDKPLWFRWSMYYVMIMMVLVYGQFGAKQFIYFQF